MPALATVSFQQFPTARELRDWMNANKASLNSSPVNFTVQYDSLSNNWVIIWWT
jgi:hypothetical protein